MSYWTSRRHSHRSAIPADFNHSAIFAIHSETPTVVTCSPCLGVAKKLQTRNFCPLYIPVTENPLSARSRNGTPIFNPADIHNQSQIHDQRAAGSSWCLENASFTSIKIIENLILSTYSQRFKIDIYRLHRSFINLQRTSRIEQSLSELQQRNLGLRCTTQSATVLSTRYVFERCVSLIS